MRSLVLFALLVSAAAAGAADMPIAKKKQELAARAMEASQNTNEYPYLLGLLQPIPSDKLRVRDMRPYVLPGEGWLTITDQGVWSVGNESSLYIVLGENDRPRQLQLQGSYFQGNEPTRLFVNGHLLSETALRDHTVELPPDIAESPFLHIKLQHLNPVSRQEIDPRNKSDKKIKFLLEQIRVW